MSPQSITGARIYIGMKQGGSTVQYLKVIEHLSYTEVLAKFEAKNHRSA